MYKRQKRRIYKHLRTSYEGRNALNSRKNSYQAEAGQMIAQKIKEGIEVQVKGIKEINWKQGKMIELRKEVAKAANTIANRDIFGMGDLLGTGIGGQMGGVQGAIIGLTVRQLISRPSIASRLGIGLFKDSAGKKLGRFAVNMKILDDVVRENIGGQ